jgi:hypothetical protein
MGIRSVVATNTTIGTNLITLVSATGFSVNDPVVFTGSVFGNVQVGMTYYITSISTNNITISETVGGTNVTLTTASGSMTMAKSGDYALLPEPFYFNQSIVKYNNRVYQCIISNNDPEFILGKWEEIRSDNRILNELDRIVGYYKPEKSNTLAWSNYINMPGLDLTQLVDGITYPNSVYLGNAFAPADEFPIDTILTDKPFYPANLGTVGIIWEDTKYVAIANSPTNSNVLESTDGETYVVTQMTVVPVSTTDITYGNGYYIVTTTNNNTPIYISADAIVWTTTGVGTIATPTVNIENTMLRGVTYNGTNYIAVGEQIYTSNDVYNWTSTYQFNNGLTNVLNAVANINATYFNGLIAVGKGQQNLSGIISNCNLLLISLDNGDTWASPTSVLTTSGFNDVAAGNNTIVVVGENGVVYTSNNGSSYAPQASGVILNLNAVTYGLGLFVVVGENGLVITSNDDGVTWIVRATLITHDLYDVTFNGVDQFVAVGENSAVLVSSDGINWSSTTDISDQETFYTVQGSPFLSGYGPEELVPGVVTDNVQMTINTRPGTNWEATIYGHAGYRVISLEFTPTNPSQVAYSFKDVSRNPAAIAVFVINATTGLSTSIYNTDYTIDWINQEVILNTPLNYFPDPDLLRIDVYDVGNGDQLVKSNSLTDPIRENTTTGFSEIELSCNYSAAKTNGSGVVRSSITSTYATATVSASNSIVVDDVSVFTINGLVTFANPVFGNIVAGTHYYVKTINYSTSSITVSDTLISGFAGATFLVTDDVGNMEATPETSVWSDPYVQHNGTRLLLGDKFSITGTDSATNTVGCITTLGMAPGDPISFGIDIIELAAGIDPFTTQVYNVLSVVSSTSFTLEDPLNPGNPLTLADSMGGATAITYDYVFALSDNGISAKMIFTAAYQTNTDYLAYTVFGETTPEQYGFTVPQTELITSDGSTTYSLDNYVGGDNPENAIVEVNGLRISPADYTINSNALEITFSVVPAIGDIIAVTTYNLTQRQYFNTQTFNVTSTAPNNTVTPIDYVDNVIAPPIADTPVSQTSSTGNIITCDDTSNFVVGQTAIFKDLTGTTFGTSNVKTDGTVYFVESIVSSTEFTISTTPGGPAFNPGNYVGVCQVFIGGLPTVRVTTTVPHNLVTNDVVRVDDIVGSTQLNNNTYYAHVIDATRVDLYLEQYQPLLTGINSPILGVASYVSGGYIFVDGIFTIYNTTGTATNATGNLITVASTNSLVPNTPVIFTGDVGSSNIVVGKTYYIKDIELVSPNTFTISEIHNGDEFVLATASGLDFFVSQWEQTNVNRLWVTINGYRVPSSSLYLNPDNNLSILTGINSGDEIIVTSMIPSPTPDEETYVQVLNKEGEQFIYRANTQTRTWLTQDLDITDTTIYVQDATRLTAQIVQNEIAPAAVNGVITVGLDADKRIITQIIVYNNTTAQTVATSNYYYDLVDIAPVIRIIGGVTAGDSITVTVIEGNTIFINGEQIRFTSVDIANNTLTGLSRGVNGTGAQTLIPKYSEIFGYLSENLMSRVQYNKTWNSYVYNTVEGDPLQISQTAPAEFLNQDIG